MLFTGPNGHGTKITLRYISKENNQDSDGSSPGGDVQYDTENLPNYIVWEGSHTPIVNSVDEASNDDPIVIQTGPDAPAILLLEQTDYWIKVESDCSDELDCQPLIEGLTRFSKNPFESSGNVRTYTFNFEGYVGNGYLKTIWGEIPFEVRSKKMGYYSEYMTMLEDLAEFNVTDIINSDSPLFQHFSLEEALSDSPKFQFMVLDYMLSKDRFLNAFRTIKSNPIRNTVQIRERIPAGCADYIDPEAIIDMLSPDNLERVPGGVVDSRFSPIYVDCIRYKTTHDTPENRFVAFVISRLIHAVKTLRPHSKGYKEYRLERMSELLSRLSKDPWFNGISHMDHIPFRSTALRLRPGYRDVFRYYIMLGHSARLGLDPLEPLEGHIKKLETLYEDWCYIQLVNSLDRCSIKHEGLGKIKHNDNNQTWFEFNMNDEAMPNTAVRLYKNKQFSRFENELGFYSTSLVMKPDYTLVVIQEYVEKTRRLIINFDAKYRLSKSGPKKDDIYTMHTYRDSLFFSNCAVALYPGMEAYWFLHELPKDCKKRDWIGFPAVGAIPLVPGKLKQKYLIKTICEKNHDCPTDSTEVNQSANKDIIEQHENYIDFNEFLERIIESALVYDGTIWIDQYESIKSN